MSKAPESYGGPRSNRRTVDRVPVSWAVDYSSGTTFLFAYITNISELGIFIRTLEPLEVGTRLTLRFNPSATEDPFVLDGVVAWVNPFRLIGENPNPGMGVRFIELDDESRARLVELVRTIAYVESPEEN